MLQERLIETDVLVIGGGISGFFAAIKARQQGVDVTLVDKGYAGSSGATASEDSKSFMVLNPDWGHNMDTALNQMQRTNEYIDNSKWTQIIFEDSWARYRDIIEWGIEPPVSEEKLNLIRRQTTPFTRLPVWRKNLSPGIRRLAEKIGIRIVDKTVVTELLTYNGAASGAVAFSLYSSDIYTFKAKAIAMCGGGSSFRPPAGLVAWLTGDADAMAYRIGAEITGKEFPAPHYNIAYYPAIDGDGGVHAIHNQFTDAEGDSIRTFGMDNNLVFPIHEGKGPILWDFDTASRETMNAIQKNVLQTEAGMVQKRAGVDLSRRGKYPLIGDTSAGRGRGGIWITDTNCASSIPGLFAAGDCAGILSEGLGGGWGFVRGVVTGARAGTGAAGYAARIDKAVINEEELAKAKEALLDPSERVGGFSPTWVTQLIQNTMMPYFILSIKHEQRLQAALTIIEFIRKQMVPKMRARDTHELKLVHETGNIALNAEMMLRASLFRTESRLSHFREDYPRRDDPSWLAWVKYKDDQGKMKFWKEPVPEEYWPDLSMPYKERYPVRFPGE